MKNLLRTKSIDSTLQSNTGLKRCLTAFDLTLLGIGAIVGAGIFVLTGVAAATQAGPSIIYSYFLAGFACAFTALCYAELASSIGGCGSAYGYAYVGLGELIAWIIGWNLILEYGVATSTVAIGWSGYINDMLQAFGFYLPKKLTCSPFEGGICDLPAMVIILLMASILAAGVQQSTKINDVIVFVKLVTIAIFIFVATRHFKVQNWHPFMPFGWHGVVTGAGLIFFGYIGFDAVSTAAEETINPQRNLPIAIVASLAVCTLLYVLVAGLLTGIEPYTRLNVDSPVSQALLQHGESIAAGMVAVGAIAGLTSVILVMFYGLTRILLAMSRDGLLPQIFSQINLRTQIPTRVVWGSGIIMAVIAGFTPIGVAAEMVNIGTLAAFFIVCAGVIFLRHTKPNLKRPFKTPFSPWFPLLGMMTCFYLMLSLSHMTWIRFVVWSILGLTLYFLYGIKNSKLAERS
jgi:basic amino acid/polyamine antiporter, APA family